MHLVHPNLYKDTEFVYIGMYELVMHYCVDTWGNDFDQVSWKMESIFHCYVEEYDNATLE